MNTDPDLQALHERIQRGRAATAARVAQQAAQAQQAAPTAPTLPAAAPPSPAAGREPAGTAPSGSLTAQQRLIWGIVRAAQLAGAKNLTRAEIRARWEAQSGTRQSDGTVSGRVHEMLHGRKTAGWLQELNIKRMCTATGEQAFPVCVPSHLLNVSPARGGPGA
jgi:hypothetical protein